MLRWGDVGIVGLEALVRERFDIQAIFSHLDASKECSGCPRTGVLPFVNVLVLARVQPLNPPQFPLDGSGF